MGLEHIVRPAVATNIGPPKTSQSLGCEERAATVVLQFGKGGSGKVSSVSYSFAFTTYMTKQQREICNTPSVDDLGRPIDPSVDPEA